MSEVRRLPLADVLEFREGPGILAKDFCNSGVPLIRLAGLKEGANLLDGCNYLNPDEVAVKWRQFRLLRGDVLLSTSASLGEVAVVDQSAEGAIPYTGIVAFRPRDNRVDPAFVRFALVSPSFKQQIQEMGVGSVMRHFGPSHLRCMTIDAPSVSQQRAIAEVLGALDDKIAANTKLARTADDLATMLFLNSRRGLTLSGNTFEGICTVGGGGTPSTSVSAYWDGHVPWVTPTDVTALAGPYLSTTSRLVTDLGLANCSSPLYPAGSILMTSRATIGAFAMAQIPIAVNQGFIVVIPRDPELRYWVFHEMRTRVEEFKALANGATFMELSRGRFRRLPLHLPSSTLAREFNARAGVLHSAASAAMDENRRLAATRDTLLPHLMSGRLRVKDAEAVVEEAL